MAVGLRPDMAYCGSSAIKYPAVDDALLAQRYDQALLFVVPRFGVLWYEGRPRQQSYAGTYRTGCLHRLPAVLPERLAVIVTCRQQLSGRELCRDIGCRVSLPAGRGSMDAAPAETVACRRSFQRRE